jgi:hypothetical protein
VPEPPGWINEFQFITKFFFNTCHHPFTLYIEMAFPPTVHAADMLLAVDLPQIARTLFRPGGNRTKRHGRKSDPKRRGPFTKVPDPNDSAAALVRDATDIGDRVVSDGPRALWTLLDLGESIIGKVFIIGLIEQWLYEYALYIDASAPSDCGLPAVRGEGGGDLVGSGGVSTIGGCDAVWATGGAGCANGTIFMPASRWMACCSGSIQNIGSGTGGTESIVVTVQVVDGDGHPINGSPTTKALAYMEKQDFISTVFFNSGESVGCFWQAFQHGITTSRGLIGDVVMFAQSF